MDPPPDIGGDRAPHGEMGIGQDVLRLGEEPERVEPVGQGADDGVEEPGPVKPGEEARHGPGQEDERLGEALAGEIAVEEERQDEA